MQSRLLVNKFHKRSRYLSIGKAINERYSVCYLIKLINRQQFLRFYSVNTKIHTKIPINCGQVSHAECHFSGVKLYWIYQKYDDWWLFISDKPDKAAETARTRGDIVAIETHRSKA